MFRLRWSAATAAVLMTLVATAGCSSGAAATAKQSALQRVTKDKVLKVATEQGNPPYSSVAAGGGVKGFDIDIVDGIAKALGAKVQYSYVNDAGRIAALQTGKVDLVAANFTITPERALNVGFTQPYLVVRGELLTKANEAGLKTLEDVNKPSVRIAVTRGGTAQQNVAKAVPKATAVVFNSVADCVQALTSGQVDAISQDQLFNAGMVRDHPGQYKPIKGYISTEQIGLGYQKGDLEWAQWLNIFLRDYNASGTQGYDFEKWFGFAMPSLTGQ